MCCSCCVLTEVYYKGDCLLWQQAAIVKGLCTHYQSQDGRNNSREILVQTQSQAVRSDTDIYYSWSETEGPNNYIGSGSRHRAVTPWQHNRLAAVTYFWTL